MQSQDAVSQEIWKKTLSDLLEPIRKGIVELRQILETISQEESFSEEEDDQSVENDIPTGKNVR